MRGFRGALCGGRCPSGVESWSRFQPRDDRRVVLTRERPHISVRVFTVRDEGRVAGAARVDRAVPHRQHRPAAPVCEHGDALVLDALVVAAAWLVDLWRERPIEVAICERPRRADGPAGRLVQIVPDLVPATEVVHHWWARGY